MELDRPLRIGISSCLLGERVRYNGDHKRADYLTALAPRVEWLPVCPEVEVGMGVPREPVRLERTPGGVKVIAVISRVDHTDSMRAWAQPRLDALIRGRLCGYVFKKDSPSCGVSGVKIHEPGAVATPTGRGLFAAAVIERLPELPVEEEGGLAHPERREQFLQRCAAYRAEIEGSRD